MNYFTFLYEIDCEREDRDLRIKEAKSSISTPIERLKETIGLWGIWEDMWHTHKSKIEYNRLGHFSS